MRIGLIGAGQMATALASGFAKAGLCQPQELFAFDVVPQTLEAWHRTTGGTVCTSNGDVCEKSDVLILAVKPQSWVVAVEDMARQLAPHHLVVSIIAGTTLGSLQARLGPSVRLIRVMPNTPCLVGCAATGIALGAHAHQQDRDTVLSLFESVGVAFVVPEPLLDAITGLSGSGPAFVFQMIEAMSDGGVAAGLPRNIASTLAAQTFFGAAKMVLESRKHPAELKDQVASPGGTTIAGIWELERSGLRGTIMNAVVAASRRATELGQE
jgi:pyrroline-5-carboxylate reductase